MAFFCRGAPPRTPLGADGPQTPVRVSRNAPHCEKRRKGRIPFCLFIKSSETNRQRPLPLSARSEAQGGAVAAGILKNTDFSALARKWTIFGGSVLMYMTDKNRPVTQTAQKGLFLTDDFGMAESRNFPHQARGAPSRVRHPVPCCGAGAPGAGAGPWSGVRERTAAPGAAPPARRPRRWPPGPRRPPETAAAAPGRGTVPP